MAATGQEARRRKILERGSDRLALITGRIHDIQPPPPSSHLQPSGADADSLSQPLIADDQAIRPHISHPNTTAVNWKCRTSVTTFTDQLFLWAVSPQGEAEESDPILLKADPVEQVQPLPGSSVFTSEADQVPPLPDSSVTSGTQQQLQLHRAIVVAQLLTGKQTVSERAAARQNETCDGDQWIGHLSRALEAGFVMRNVMDALFMDCASYAVLLMQSLSYAASPSCRCLASNSILSAPGTVHGLVFLY
ncbi:uncharacterized protein LOC129294599 [Prosopis cineraria]|uniref:uncharacterized protein LOC129294599 n=1 Tax=Prosopis cineraria TaxID=364024 RepID=UPI00240F55EA|nr:uncharacterized protein LOC129294599 [Prosopis cineraria]